MIETATELAVVNAQNAVEIFTRGGLGAILDGIESKVRGMQLDASTPSGRDEIRSVAYKVTRTKTALDAEAKKLTEGWRTATAQVNAERKHSQERLEALAEEVRAPLTAVENKEKNRIAAHEAALAEITGLLAMLRAHPAMEASLLEEHQQDFDTLHADREWEEFGYRAKKARAEVSDYLAERIAARKKFDADQAELERLRKEEAERQARERDERLKAEAAEKARIDAERKAKEAADAEARRVVEAARKEQDQVRAEAERVRAEHDRAQREAEAARQREQQAREDAERRAAAAEAARLEALRRAETEKKTAEERAKRDTEAAVARERERAERQLRAEEDARRKREADEKHRALICGEILEDLNDLRLDRTVILNAITEGKIRHVRVTF